MKQDEHTDKLRDLNRTNSRFWAIQQSLSEQYRERAKTPEQALQADQFARDDAQSICSPAGSLRLQRRLTPGKRGPKPEPQKNKRIAELKAKHSWPQVKKILAAEGINLSIGAIRYRYSKHKASPC